MNESGRRLLLAAILIALIGSAAYLPVADWVTFLVDWGRRNTFAGPIVYMLFVIIATVLFLPGSIAMMIGGFVFGFLPGLLFAAIAIPLGAQSAFEFGRWIVRPWIRRKVADNKRMHMIESALREEAFLIVALTRLSLIVPFNLLNYVYGATSVKARTHLFATALGMLPAVALYVYLGTIARDLSQILAGDAAPQELGYWLLGAGLIVISAAVWVIQRTATRVLEKHLGSPNGAKQQE